MYHYHRSYLSKRIGILLAMSTLFYIGFKESASSVVVAQGTCALKEGYYSEKFFFDPTLGYLLDKVVQSYRAPTRSLAETNEYAHLLTFREDIPYIQVDIVGTKNNNTAEVLDLGAILASNGFPGASCFKHMCSIEVFVTELPELASIPNVTMIVEAKPGLGRITPSASSTDVADMNDRILQGSVISEGDKAMYADKARVDHAVNGTGLLVGVLSDSYNCLGGAASDIRTGDLPSNTSNTSNILIVKDWNDVGCTDEGRAMMQIIHDVAPGARLAFRTGVLGQADFAKGIVELADAGCDIIVDDIYYLEPFYQDGVISQAVDQVIGRGVAYFTFAGNFGRNAWETFTGFSPSNITDFDGEFHKFGTNPDGTPKVCQNITLPRIDVDVPIIFQWGEPYVSGSGLDGKGSKSDMEIFISGGGKYWKGLEFNIGRDPMERIYINPSTIASSGDTVTVTVAIQLRSGPPPKRMKLIVLLNDNGDATFEFGPGSSTIFGHMNNRNACTIAAAPYSQTPAYGVSPAVVESSSSLGTLASLDNDPILFDLLGDPVVSDGVLRDLPPKVTGPSGGINTFFGPNKRFFGTSAAAAHVAAVAALMLEKEGGRKTIAATDICEFIERTALDMDNPYTSEFDKNYDGRTGAGFVNASEVMTYLSGRIPPPPMRAPVSAPIPPSPSPSPCYCLSRANTVQILKRKKGAGNNMPHKNHNIDMTEEIRMSDLQVGDYVRTSGNKYTRVISFCHKSSTMKSTFLQIDRSPMQQLSSSSLGCCSSGYNRTINSDGETKRCNECTMTTVPTLEITNDHMVYVIRSYDDNMILADVIATGTKGWIRAQDVLVGDIMISTATANDDTTLLSQIGYHLVTNIRVIERSGFYAPITNTGSFYVSDSLVSSYVAVIHRSKNNLPFAPNVQHWIAHIILTPIRFACWYDFSTFCENESYDNDGFAWYSKYIVTTVEWISSLNIFSPEGQVSECIGGNQLISVLTYLMVLLQWMITFVLVLPFAMLYLVECLCIGIHNMIGSTCSNKTLMVGFCTTGSLLYSFFYCGNHAKK